MEHPLFTHEIRVPQFSLCSPRQVSPNKSLKSTAQQGAVIKLSFLVISFYGLVGPFTQVEVLFFTQTYVAKLVSLHYPIVLQPQCTLHLTPCVFNTRFM
jgi:hypothetical protein